jgi:hypothetical protein
MPSTSTNTPQGHATETQSSWAPVVTLVSIVALAYVSIFGAILVQLV